MKNKKRCIRTAMLSFLLLFSLPTLANSGRAPKTPSQRSPSVPQRASNCLLQVGMSNFQSKVYGKIKEIVPDPFCCSESNPQARVDCLGEKADALTELSSFIDKEFIVPIYQLLDSHFPSHTLCTKLSDQDEVVEGIHEVKCVLTTIGESLGNVP